MKRAALHGRKRPPVDLDGPPPALTGHDRIYTVVRAIPAGRVMSYGAIATAAGLPGRARLVGHLMGSLPDGSTVPWHRVVNSQGRISPRGSRGSEWEQRIRLQAEGVQFDTRGAVDLVRFGHVPFTG